MKSTLFRRLVLPLFSFVAVVLGWQLACSLSGWSSSAFPGPMQTFQSLWQLCASGELVRHEVDSLFRVILGVDPTYDMTLFIKDVTYLTEKKYIEFASSPINQQIFSKKIARLTPAGKEIADQTLTDKALEI